MAANTHPPIPTASLPPLPPQFDDIPKKARDCWDDYFGYRFTGYFLQTEFDKSITRIGHTYNPPLSYESTYSYDHTTNCSTSKIAPSTLCDQTPRARNRVVQCRTVPTIGTATNFVWYTDITLITPTWTSEFAQPSPTCQVAEDLSPMCARLFDAWSYRTERMQKTLVSQANVHAIPPCTPLVSQPASTALPFCRIAGATFSARYWPSATPSGSDFCNASYSVPMPLPTIPGRPNTAIISGLTFTSPSVYHFLKDMVVETYLGIASQPGGIGYLPYGVWSRSTIIPTATIAQPESEIIEATKACSGREADYCTMYFRPGFQIQDLSTVRADKYDQYCKARYLTDCAIYQDWYQPTLAIPLTEVARQNSGVLGNCQWPLYDANDEHGWLSHTSSTLAALLVRDVKATAFVPITTAVPTPKNTAVPLARRSLCAQATPTAP